MDNINKTIGVLCPTLKDRMCCDNSDRQRNVVTWVLKVSACILLPMGFMLGYAYPYRNSLGHYLFRIQWNMHEQNPQCPNSARLDHLERMCHSTKWGAFHSDTEPDRSFYQHLLVDNTHRLLYCVVPRSASRSITTLLLSTSQTHSGVQQALADTVSDRKFLRSYGLKYLDDLGDVERNYRLKNFHKVLIVRHPLDRLYSLYHSQHHLDTFKMAALRKFGIRISDDQGGIQMTLSQYLELVMDPSISNDYWDSVNDLCHPCEIQYDQVLKMETIADDSAHLLELLAANGVSVLPKLNVDTPLDKDKLLESSIAFDDVSYKQMNKLLRLYSKDMDLFGYSYNNKTGLACGNTKHHGQQCC